MKSMTEEMREIRRLMDDDAARSARYLEDRPKRDIIRRWLSEGATDEEIVEADRHGINVDSPWNLSALFTPAATSTRTALACWMTANDVKWPGAIVIVMEGDRPSWLARGAAGRDIQFCWQRTGA